MEGGKALGGAGRSSVTRLTYFWPDTMMSMHGRLKKKQKHKDKKKTKQQAMSESCYRKNTNVISTQIYITQFKKNDKKKKLKKKV